MNLVITPKEVCKIKSDACETWLEFEKRMTYLNHWGHKYNMKEGNELMVYVTLLNDIDFPNFQEDTYVTMLSNRDFYKMHTRILDIRSKIY